MSVLNLNNKIYEMIKQKAKEDNRKINDVAGHLILTGLLALESENIEVKKIIYSAWVNLSEFKGAN